jgi:hypothetical protein
MRKKAGTKATSPAARPAGERRLVLGRLLAKALALLVIGVSGIYVLATRSPASPPMASPPRQITVDSEKVAKTATYVGAKVCKTCHEGEFRAWSGSHHDLAMQEATAASVLGNFADARFRHQGVESSFFKRGDRFMVRTDGPDGKLADYEIA